METNNLGRAGASFVRACKKIKWSFKDERRIASLDSVINFTGWNEWIGLCVEEVTAEYSDGKISFTRDKDRLKMLFPYDCKMRY